MKDPLNFKKNIFVNLPYAKFIFWKEITAIIYFKIKFLSISKLNLQPRKNINNHYTFFML